MFDFGDEVLGGGVGEAVGEGSEEVVGRVVSADHEFAHSQGLRRGCAEDVADARVYENLVPFTDKNGSDCQEEEKRNR